VRKDEPQLTYVRRLRLAQSELGEVDPAALFEFKKDKKIVYEGYKDTTCLVEADGE
jgi:glutamyl-tRNA(Gln) amidotransferase subunit E